MTAESARPLNPEPAEFAGESRARIAKRLFHATRPKFFPASVLPVVMGSAWGVAAASSFDGLVFVLALLATVCVHAASNVINDVDDDSNGTDPRNGDRIYPYTGGSRFIQSGILSRSSMAKLGYSLIGVAVAIGLLLIALKGTMVLWFGLAGVALGILYSLGPVRLSALGIGELAVAVAFGIVPVTGAAWLQGAALTPELFLFAVPISVWVGNILLINEVPDVRADGAVGKRTLPVRFGLGATSAIYLVSNIVAAAAVIALTIDGSLPVLAPLVPLGLLVLAYKASVAIRSGVAERENMAKAIESTLAIHTLGSIWLAGCALFLWLSAA